MEGCVVVWVDGVVVLICWNMMDDSSVMVFMYVNDSMNLCVIEL